jgi:aminomethyltransferase
VLAVLSAEASSHMVELTDLTESVALIGIDGPFSWELLKDIVGVRMLGLRYLEFLEKQPIGGGEAYVIRAGKTGEFGYQIMIAAEHAAAAWAQLLEAGKKYDAIPAGYEALDLCRLENRFINMHCEGKAAKNPLELNCRVMVDQEKDGYIGHESITDAISSGLENRVIGIAIEGGVESTPAIGDEIVHSGQKYGKIVNVGYSPSLGKPIALALLAADVAFVGLEFEVQLASGSTAAKTVSAPFVFNRSMTVRPQEDSYHNR